MIAQFLLTQSFSLLVDGSKSEMNRSLSHSLLIDNDLYLEAVRHRRVTVENLGFQELQYNYGNTRNKTGKRVLKAVIPENDQLEFLQKVGLVEASALPIAEHAPETKPSKQRIRKKRDHTQEHGHKVHGKDKNAKGKQSKPIDDADETLNKTHPVRRTSVGGTPLYTKPSQAFLNILESEKEDAIFRTKMKERFTKLGTSFEIVDKEGVKYVYDQRGFKVTEEAYNKYLEEVERDKRRRTAERVVPPHKTEIIEKTRRFVEDLRKRIESETILDYKWYPGKFPATTLVPRPQSADGRYANSMRDISTLGKTMAKSSSTAFRKGEPHCLPINLVRNWPEYRVMEEGDVVLTVEHCCNCQEHDMCTHHNEEKYAQMAENVRENLTATASKFAVRFYSVCKPVEFEDPLAKSLSHSERIVTGQSSHMPNKAEKTAFNIDYTQRVGAFEVQVAVRTKKDFICHLLFSKLFKGAWPRISTLQALLERVLTEAKFCRLVNDVPRTPSRSSSRPSSPKRVPFYVPKEEVAQELHPEFDKRLPPADDTPEASPARSPEPYITLEPAPTKVTPASKAPHNHNHDHHLTPLQIGEFAWGESPMVSPPPTGGHASYTSEEQAAASALARFMKGKSNPNTTTNSSGFNSNRGSFGVESDSDSMRESKKINSTKAVMLAVGSAAAGLQFVRNKSKSAAEVEKTGLLTHEEALAIANTSPEKNKAHMVKKQPTIGVLSRQNAGGGQQGRYLMIDNDEDISLGPPTDGGPPSSTGPSTNGRGETRAFFPHPLVKTNSQTSIPFSTPASGNSGSPGEVSPMSPKRASPNKKSSFAAVEEEDETMGFSPMNSSKRRPSMGLRPVAQVVDIATHGLAFVRHRSSSVTSMPQSPTLVEKLHERQSTGKITQSERIQGRPSPLRQHAHPSLEMRSKLNIGMLSRQNAGIRGDSLVVADSDSDTEQREGDQPEAEPPRNILDAMAKAVQAVNEATESEKDLQKAKKAPTQEKEKEKEKEKAPMLQKKIAVPMEIPPYVAPTAPSGADPRRPHTVTTLETATTGERRDQLASLDRPVYHGHTEINTPMSALTMSTEAYGSNAATPTTAPSQNFATVSSAAGTPVATTASAGNLAAAVRSSAPSPAPDAAATQAEPAPVSAPSPAPAPAEAPAFQEGAFASTKNNITDRRMSSAEILQQKRGLADQLVLKVSRDILDPTQGDYADDFDDFEDFSPSPGKKGKTGFDDLFENSDYKLDDE